MNDVNKKTILIVDDSPMIREMIKDFLNDKFNYLEAGDPKECLETLAATTPRVDLGLIDVEMPFMTGYKLIAMIKKHASYARVPFIMVTSRDSQDDIKKAVLAGACDYISKPFDDETLLEKIEKHLKEDSFQAPQKQEDPIPQEKEENQPPQKDEPPEAEEEIDPLIEDLEEYQPPQKDEPTTQVDDKEVEDEDEVDAYWRT